MSRNSTKPLSATNHRAIPLDGIFSRGANGRLSGVLILALAGVFAALATPGFLPSPYGSYMAFVAFIPMFWAWDNVRSFSPFVKGYLFGFAYFIVNSFWLYNTAYQYGMPAIVGLVVYVVVFGLAFYYAAISLFYSRVRSPILVAAFVGGIEIAKGVVLTGYPFGNIGVMLYGLPWLVQGASFYGEIGLTVFVVLVNLGLYYGVVLQSRKGLVYVAIGFGGLLLPNLYYSPSQYSALPEGSSELSTTLQNYYAGYATSVQPFSLGGTGGGSLHLEPRGVDGEELKVLLVQTGLDQRDKWSVRRSSEVLSYATTVVREASYQARLYNPDLVVFPESVYPKNMNGVGEIEELLNTYFSTTPVLMGVIYNRATEGAVTDLSSNATALAYREVGVERNSFTSVYAHRNADEKYTVYDKNRLVLLGEYLPLYSLLKPVYGIFYGFDSGEGYSRGKHIGTINISVGSTDKELRILPLLCMEASFSSSTTSYALGSFNVITIMGNDDWFKTDIAKQQHLAMHTMRAIESRKYVLRSGQTGVTTVIKPNGVFEPSNTSGVMFSLQYFSTNNEVTLFSKVKYWWLLPLVVLGVALWVRRRFTKKLFTI